MTRVAKTGRELLLSKVTEKEWLAQVIHWAKRGGFLIYHTFNSYGSVGGFPDLCMVRGERVIFAELKREGGKLSDLQQRWISSLQAVPGVEVFVWKPSDEEQVKAVLA